MTKPIESPIPGPRSIRSRIRIALLADLFLNEDGILSAIRNQEGGRILLRDYGDQLGAIKVQAAQVRKELQERANIAGSRQSPAGRAEINKQWLALPEEKRIEIIDSFGQYASYWLPKAA